MTPTAEPQESEINAATEAEVQAGPTAKEMAAAEELNAVRAQQIINAQQHRVEAEMQEPVSIIGLAAQGREALLEGLRQHAERAKPKEHVPPPRTARQMAQLEAELSAGRRTQQRAAEQQANRPVPPADPNKEGFTTPVHRPNNLVPDPTIPAAGGYVAGTRPFGA